MIERQKDERVPLTEQAPHQNEQHEHASHEHASGTHYEHENKFSQGNQTKKRKLLPRKEYLRRRLLSDNKYYDNID